MKYHEVRPGQFVPEAPEYIPASEPYSVQVADSTGQVYVITWDWSDSLDYTVERDDVAIATAPTLVAALEIVRAQ